MFPGGGSVRATATPAVPGVPIPQMAQDPQILSDAAGHTGPVRAALHVLRDGRAQPRLLQRRSLNRPQQFYVPAKQFGRPLSHDQRPTVHGRCSVRAIRRQRDRDLLENIRNGRLHVHTPVFPQSQQSQRMVGVSERAVHIVSLERPHFYMAKPRRRVLCALRMDQLNGQNGPTALVRHLCRYVHQSPKGIR